MDKNKGRTDLLAAGRKKLQQYRQKKDGKGSGSHVKSSKKSGKSEQHDGDDDVTSAAAEPMESLQIPEWEMGPEDLNSNVGHIDLLVSQPFDDSVASDPVLQMESLQIPERDMGPDNIDSNVGHVDLSVSQPFYDSVAPYIVLPTVNQFPGPGQLEAPGGEMGDACNSRFPVEGSEIDEVRSNSSVGNEHDSHSFVLNEQKSYMTIEPDMIRVTSLRTGSLPVDLSAPLSADRMSRVLVTVDTKSVDREDEGKLLLLEQDLSDALLIQAREDQVTDVGAMQEADCSGSKQLDQISGVELEGDETPDFSEFAEGAEMISGVVPVASIMKSTHDPEQPDASAVAGNESEGLSLTKAMPTDEVLAVDHEMADQWRENIVVSSFNEEKSGVYLASGDSGSYMEVAIQAGLTKQADCEGSIHDKFPDGSFKSKGESYSKTLGTKMVNLFGGSDVTPREDLSSISLLQLAEVIKGLDEDEFRFLLKSKESAPNGSLGDTSSFLVPEDDLSEVLETYKEQLYLTNITKDIFTLQLLEHSRLQQVFDHQHQQLDDKISMLSASLNEASDTNKSLAEELAQSQSELQAVTSGREELKHEFQTAAAEVAEFSARVHELQNELESSRRDFSGLSLELADCKSVVVALRVENSSLSGSLTLAMEEIRNLEEELARCKGLVADMQVENDELSGSLAFVTEERKKLEGAKEYFLCENEKLLSQLADCKSLLEVVEVEKSNVSGTLTLMTEEMKKLEEGKHHFFYENDRLRSELAECQSIVKAIQMENDNLSEGLSLVTDERRKLEEEKENLTGENKGLSSEFRMHQELLSASQAKNLQLEDDLREMNLRFEQLLEENIFLDSSLNIHKAKIMEINHMQIQLAFHSREPSRQIESPDLPSRVHINITNDEDSHQISGGQDGEFFSPLLEVKSLSDGYAGAAPKQLEQNVYSDASGFPDFNGRLEEADKVLQKLEKVIEVIHSHSSSLSRSGGKVAASGVSKLIQAFESKTHLEDGEVEENLMTEDRSIADPFMLSKHQTVNLRAVLKELQLDAVNAIEIFKGEKDGREAANVAYTELKVQYEAIREHTDNLEAMNIELEVQCEAVKQHVSNDEEKKRELVVLYESLQQENISLKAENTELGKKLNDFNVRINELHSQLGELQQSSEEIASSICNQIENLRSEAADNLEAARTDHEAICNSYKEVIEKLNDLREKNELAVGLLNKIYGNLRILTIDSSVSVEESELNLQKDEILDPLDTRKFEDLMEQLGTFLGERSHLKFENNKLNTELVSRTKDMEELNRRCLDLKVVLKLVEDAEAIVKSEDMKIDIDKPPVSRLDSFVRFLLQRYIEADERVNMAREELGSKVVEFSEQHEKINQLDSLNLSQKNEIVRLKESLSKAEEAIVAVRSELQVKTVEVEQSEQRVSSVREKLSIAVAKGKGLIVQRDNLKQSLSEASIELERSSQELQLKDARLYELEEKLKMYSEAGERVEALESELSYIRNSATALRESFLLKDSVLQRIEEILEDLELPENFHNRDIIEKVDWLARSVTGNSLPPIDWDQKSSVEGGSHSDAGFVIDGWKEDMQPNSNPGDGLRRKYEELQGKFYELAEQNEMLEQSLMERNSLVQRWEEVLDRINMPTQLRSMEPEDRMKWLGSELSEAHRYANALQQKIDNLENHCGTLTADLEESQRRLSDFEAALQVVTHDKEILSKSLETLTCDHEKLVDQTAHFEFANDKLQNECTSLQEQLVEKHFQEKQVDRIEGEITRLQDLVSDALQDPATKDLVSGGSSIECLGGLLTKLVDNYTSLCSEKPIIRTAVDAPATEKVAVTLDDVRNRETFEAEKPDVLLLKKELEEALSDLTRLKEEGDNYMEKHQSLVSEVETLNKKMEELQELLIQEEKKSASAREKLNVAVRKGKSLVQQRDSLKQTIEERNNEVESLKSVISQRENFAAQCEQRIKDLSTYPERVAFLESENFSLSNHLTETKHSLQEKGHTLVLILNTLGEIDIGGEYSHSDPVVKLEQLGKLCSELHAAVCSSEQESRKSKRAAELLLQELNEVQERNDSLQEELAKAGSELIALSKERDMAQAAKLEAFSRLENLSAVHSEAKKNEHADFMALKSVVHQLRGSFFDVNNLLADVLFKDLEFLHNLEANMELCLKSSGATNLVGLSLVNAHGSVPSYLENKFLARDFGADIKRQEYYDGRDAVEVCRDVGHDLQVFTTEISALQEKIQKHSFSLDEKAGKLSTVLETICRELTSQAELCEALKKHIVSFESLEKEKDMENVVLHKNISLLYEACSNSVMEIENRKSRVFGNSFPSGDVGTKLKSAAAANGELLFSGRTLLSSEELIRTMADGLLMLVKELASMEAEIVEGRQKEMKTTIANLQRELQEKDMQKDRICMELVGQIREAEAAATCNSVDLQSAKTQVHDLQKRMEVMEEEQRSLEQRVKELQDRETTSIELQERVRSMTEMVAAKDQEIESLMQALDEEEMQMEELANKISELEKVLHQKNIDLENLEASRGKTMKKLSITVNKFDELHNLSASLLAEVEKLQSQLQDRDSEISFLRQEVTRCTNDVLIASQMSNKMNSDEIHALLTWLDTMISRVQVHDVNLDDLKDGQIHEFKEILQKQITSIISELEDLRTMAQSKDALIQIERSRVEELTRKGDIMENSLRQKETQLNIFKNAQDSREETSTTPEIVEAEPLINNWTVPETSIASKVRSLRKVNNDQVAIAIDMDPTSSARLEDEDDDKVHGFKSLTTSRIVPRFTRPVTDMIDGLWVSCDRALMRQPALRLGIIIYWAVLHALFATFAV